MGQVPFEWLFDRQRRHGSLARIQTAVARGWLKGPELADRRAALVEALSRLLDDPAAELNGRETVQISRIFVAMASADCTLARTPRAPRKRRKRLSVPHPQGEGGAGAP